MRVRVGQSAWDKLHEVLFILVKLDVLDPYVNSNVRELMHEMRKKLEAEGGYIDVE